MSWNFEMRVYNGKMKTQLFHTIILLYSAHDGAVPKLTYHYDHIEKLAKVFFRSSNLIRETALGGGEGSRDHKKMRESGQIQHQN